MTKQKVDATVINDVTTKYKQSKNPEEHDKFH